MSRPRRQSQRQTVPAVVAAPAPSAPRLLPRSLLTWACVGFVLIVTWLALRPALEGQWLGWDDEELLLDRDEWRGLGAQNLGWMFTTFHMGPYQPLSWLSYALDHALFDLDARAFHRTNLVLHVAAAAGLFFLARELFALVLGPERLARRGVILEIAAAITALLWSIHPLRVESVAWVTERRDCLSGLFFFAALLAWTVHARGDGTRGRTYWLALILCTACLLSKGIALAFPLVLLALDVWPLRRTSRAKRVALLLEKAPFALLSLAVGITAVVGQRVAGAVVRTEVHDLSARVVQSFYGLWFYVQKTLWPSDLMVLVPMRVPLNPGEPRFVIAISIVVAVTIALVMLRRRAPAAVAACVCYALLVAPVLGLVQVGSQLVADRYSYLSTSPLILLLGGVLLLSATRLLERGIGVGAATAPLVAGAALLVPLGIAAERQTHVWHDTFALWDHDLAIDPASSPGRRNAMTACERAARASDDPRRRRQLLERALDLCREGEAIAPDAGSLAQAAKVHDLLAAEVPERRAEHLAAALDCAQRSVQLVERTLQRLPEAFEGAGVVLAELGRPEEALPYLRKLVVIDPGHAGRHGLLGEVLMQAGRTEEALLPLQEARRLDPASTTVLLDLGDAFRALGRKSEAVEAYERVLELRRASGAGSRADADAEAARGGLESLRRAP